ncbi:signal recognition particle-docking protein FtsY [Caedibacter taeniospiralis]|jgi:fused signal recognition particle receptor|uniref:signal recognition particle-docking protein FtsY n=1 Tax=Caedibacter taeniospiralis TaxID=28907 RepID=UPI0037BE834E
MNVYKAVVTSTTEQSNEKRGVFARLKEGLKKTRSKLGAGIGELLLGKKIIDADLIDEIEMQLLTADIGVEATQEIIETVRSKVSRHELQTMEALIELLKQKLKEIITPCQAPLVIDATHKPYVILMVGMNGAGKTTTIGKLAKKFQSEGKSVMLAAGDTFRAAAVEQLQVWGERNHIPVVAQHTGADSASVIFDTIQAAKSRAIDVVIADTAGRLHTKDNLMEELKKVARVMKKLDNSAPHEVMLVLDAGTGQNAITQAEVFNKILAITGITLTKMDGTAKGGVIFAIAKKLALPIRFIGIGEKIDDLRTFNADDFIDALFTQD